MQLVELKNNLDALVLKVNRPDFIVYDPVQFPRRFTDKRDVEIVGLLSATIAWGKRSMILRNIERMLDEMDQAPYEFIMNADLDGLISDKVLHRTFNFTDFAFMCRGLRSIYNDVDSLEDIFNSENDMFDSISCFGDLMREANKAYPERSHKHISTPKKGSACKRLHLFLKWMVRNDGIVDVGCWNTIKPSQLYIPLDVHVGNSARSLGLLTRKQNDKKAVIELTEQLRILDPNDPIIYDFALFGLSEAGLLL